MELYFIVQHDPWFSDENGLFGKTKPSTSWCPELQGWKAQNPPGESLGVIENEAISASGPLSSGTQGTLPTETVPLRSLRLANIVDPEARVLLFQRTSFELMPHPLCSKALSAFWEWAVLLQNTR